MSAEREPGPVWGGWWMWEPPAGVVAEATIQEADRSTVRRPKVELTVHSIRRWQQRIDQVSDEVAIAGMAAALATAKTRHFRKAKLSRETFYIPTSRAVFVGSRGRIVTVLEREQSPFSFEDDEELGQ